MRSSRTYLNSFIKNMYNKGINIFKKWAEDRYEWIKFFEREFIYNRVKFFLFLKKKYITNNKKRIKRIKKIYYKEEKWIKKAWKRRRRLWWKKKKRLTKKKRRWLLIKLSKLTIYAAILKFSIIFLVISSLSLYLFLDFQKHNIPLYHINWD